MGASQPLFLMWRREEGGRCTQPRNPDSLGLFLWFHTDIIIVSLTPKWLRVCGFCWGFEDFVGGFWGFEDFVGGFWRFCWEVLGVLLGGFGGFFGGFCWEVLGVFGGRLFEIFE